MHNLIANTKLQLIDMLKISSFSWISNNWVLDDRTGRKTVLWKSTAGKILESQHVLLKLISKGQWMGVIAEIHLYLSQNSVHPPSCK